LIVAVIPKNNAAWLNKEFPRYVGGIVLALIIVLLVVWIRCLPDKAPVLTTTTTTSVVSRFAHERYSGPVTISQNAWMQCPAIDPTRQSIKIHIVETTVWIDWCIDGKYYREKPKCFPDHQDIMVPQGSSFCCRVTPGTAVPTATAEVTITDYP
jgi:hypothetical protein